MDTAKWRKPLELKVNECRGLKCHPGIEYQQYGVCGGLDGNGPRNPPLTESFELREWGQVREYAGAQDEIENSAEPGSHRQSGTTLDEVQKVFHVLHAKEQPAERDKVKTS